MHIQESGEMYLETILLLSRTSSHVRAIDIGEHMGYSKPSVSRAMSILKKEGYITVDADGHIHLTEEGLRIATGIYERHVILEDLLAKIGVDPEIASKDACKIEHVISESTFEAIKNYVNSNK